MALQESFLRNQSQLDEQKQSMGIGVSMTRAQAGVDSEAVSA
jgi:hypothetical protein